MSGTLPSARVPQVVAALPDLTGGEAVLTTHFDHYAPVAGADLPAPHRRGPDPGDRETWYAQAVGADGACTHRCVGRRLVQSIGPAYVDGSPRTTTAGWPSIPTGTPPATVTRSHRRCWSP